MVGSIALSHSSSSPPPPPLPAAATAGAPLPLPPPAPLDELADAADLALSGFVEASRRGDGRFGGVLFSRSLALKARLMRGHGSKGEPGRPSILLDFAVSEYIRSTHFGFKSVCTHERAVKRSASRTFAAMLGQVLVTGEFSAFAVGVNPCENTLGDLKQRIEDATGIPCAAQRLSVREGCGSDNEALLSACGLTCGPDGNGVDIVRVGFSLCGGGKKGGKKKKSKDEAKVGTVGHC